MTDTDVISGASRLIEGQETLLQVVGRVESDLVSPNVGKRNDAIRFLSDVLLLLPLSYASDLESIEQLTTPVFVLLPSYFLVSTLVRFFTARLDTTGNDNSSTSSCLKAIFYLSKCDQFNPNQNVITIVNIVLQDVAVQSLTQEVRFLVFKLIQYFLGRFPEALHQCESDFIVGFIKATEAEKDPRNLMIIFDTFLTIVSTFTIDYLAEDLFELISCYFPVDFKHRPIDEVHGITPEKLSEQLLACLTANKAFAPFCYQLIIDNFAECEDNFEPLIVLLEKALERFKADRIDYYEEKLAFCLRSVITKTKTVNLINNDLIYKCIERLVEDSYESYTGEQSVKTILESTNPKSLHQFLEDGLYLEYKSSLDPFVKNRLLNETETDLMSNWLLCASYILQLDPEVFLDQEMIIIVRKCADFSSDSASEDFRYSVTKFFQSVGHQKFNFVRNVSENSFSNLKIRQMCPMFVVNNDTAALCLPSILSARFDFVNNDDKLSFQLNLIENLKRCLEQQQNEEFKIDVLSKMFHHVLKIYVFVTDLPDQHDTEIIVRLADLAQDLMIEASSFSDSEYQLLDLMLLETSNRLSNIRCSALLDRILAVISPNLTNRFIDIIDRILIAMDIYLESKDQKIDTDVQYYTFYGRSVASVACKLEKNHPILNRIIDNYYSKLRAKLKDRDPTVIRCFGFLCKSLLMRNLTPFAELCLQQMLEFAASTGYCEALKLVENLFHEDKRLLNSNSHCICAPLYIQRVFTYCTTFIATSLEKSTDEPSDAQTNNCRILSLVLSNVPFNKQTSGQIGKVISILVDSLKPTHDSSILNPTLIAMGHLLSAKEEILLEKLSGYLPNLIESLSELSTNRSDMNLQIASLKCLSKISVTISPAILSGRRNFVLKTLTKCLDDPKRLVRKEATDCKNKWCLL